MIDAWQQAEELAEKHGSLGGIFVRLANNHDKVVGAFVGQPFTREVVWTGERYETFDKAAHHGKKPSLKVMLNFYVPAEKRMKVIEGGTAWLKDLLKVRDKYGLSDWLFEIERLGEARDPKTRYTILPDERIDNDVQADIAAAELHDLEALTKDEPEAPWAEIPDHVIQDFRRRLSALSPAAIQRFLSTFKIRKLDELKPLQEPEARELLKDLEYKDPSDDIPF